MGRYVLFLLPGSSFGVVFEAVGRAGDGGVALLGWYMLVVVCYGTRLTDLIF